MFKARPQTTTSRTSLRTVGVVNVNHSYTCRFGLVLDKGLQLTPRPAMQAGTDSLSGFDPFAQVGQCFQGNRRGTLFQRLFDHRFACLVVNLAHMPSFFSRDFTQQLLCRLTAIGLKTTPQRQMLITDVSKRTSSQNFPNNKPDD